MQYLTEITITFTCKKIAINLHQTKEERTSPNKLQNGINWLGFEEMHKFMSHFSWLHDINS